MGEEIGKGSAFFSRVQPKEFPRVLCNMQANDGNRVRIVCRHHWTDDVPSAERPTKGKGRDLSVAGQSEAPGWKKSRKKRGSICAKGLVVQLCNGCKVGSIEWPKFRAGWNVHLRGEGGLALALGHN